LNLQYIIFHDPAPHIVTTPRDGLLLLSMLEYEIDIVLVIE